MSTPTPRPSAVDGTEDLGESVPAPGHRDAGRPGAAPDHSRLPGAQAGRRAEPDPEAAADPDAASGPWPEPPGPDAATPSPGPGWRHRVLVALAVLGAVAALGVPLGLLWSAVAPHLPVRMSADGPVLTSPEPEQFIADEGWYAILAAAYGVGVAAAGWALLRRYRGPAMLAGLALGALAAGIVAWKVGSGLGLSHYEYLKAHAAVGTVFHKPVGLRVGGVPLGGFGPRVPGDTLIAAFAATATYLLFAGFSLDPDLRPHREIGDAGDRAGAGAAAERSWSAPARPTPPGPGDAAARRGGAEPPPGGHAGPAPVPGGAEPSPGGHAGPRRG